MSIDKDRLLQLEADVSREQAWELANFWRERADAQWNSHRKCHDGMKALVEAARNYRKQHPCHHHIRAHGDRLDAALAEEAQEAQG